MTHLTFGLIAALSSLTLDVRSFSTDRMKVQLGRATLLAEAPEPVREAVQAANRIVGKPYKPAGGHGKLEDDGYDCSGATSYVLSSAGLLEGARSSSGFIEYGEPGTGEWITVYARSGHVFLVIADARFDTTDHANVGPGWREATRKTEKTLTDKGFIARHPKGL